MRKRFDSFISHMEREIVDDERVGKYFEYINWDSSKVLVKNAYIFNGYRFLTIEKIHDKDFEIIFSYCADDDDHFYMNFMEIE